MIHFSLVGGEFQDEIVWVSNVKTVLETGELLLETAVVTFPSRELRRFNRGGYLLDDYGEKIFGPCNYYISIGYYYSAGRFHQMVLIVEQLEDGRYRRRGSVYREHIAKPISPREEEKCLIRLV